MTEDDLRDKVANRIPDGMRAEIAKAAGISYTRLCRWLSNRQSLYGKPPQSLSTTNLVNLLSSVGLRLKVEER